MSQSFTQEYDRKFFFSLMLLYLFLLTGTLYTLQVENCSSKIYLQNHLSPLHVYSFRGMFMNYVMKRGEEGGLP